MPNKFTVHSKNEQANLLAQKLPDGNAWRAKYDDETNFRKLLIAVGLELTRNEEYLNKIYNETQLATTEELIDEWELEYGIKGGCLEGFGNTLEERINAIRIKISANGTDTRSQFIELASKLGLSIDIIAGYDTAKFTYSFPMLFWDSQKSARFSILIDMKDVFTSKFTHTFSFVFGDSATAIMKCMFEKIKPANVQLFYTNE